MDLILQILYCAKVFKDIDPYNYYRHYLVGKFEGLSCEYAVYNF